MTTDNKPPPSVPSLLHPLGATDTVFIFIANLIIGLVWLTDATPYLRSDVERLVCISLIGVCTIVMSATFHWVRWVRGYVDARIAQAIQELKEKSIEG